MPHNFDIVCVGNAKIDTFLTLREANKHLRLIKETNELRIKFGEKITVDKAEVLLGGNAANVAVGTSRLGLSTALVAEIGKDEFAQKIINTLSSENVNTSNILQTERQQSSFSTILSFKGERTIFTEHAKRNHNFNFENISTKWIYLTSLGKEWANAYNKTVDFVKKTNCRLAFNPGTLQIAAGKKNIENVLLITDVLFVNKEEAEQILNINPEASGQISNINALLNGLQKLGPKIVVITDGENGSFAANEKGEFFSQPIIPTEIIEKTGAGDAYASGFLAATISDLPIQTAMKWGTLNASGTMSAIGAQNGLLSRKGMEEKMNG